MRIHQDNGATIAVNGSETIAAAPAGRDDAGIINYALEIGGDIQLDGTFTIKERLVMLNDTRISGGNLSLDLKDNWMECSASNVVLDGLTIDGNRDAIGALSGASEKTDGWFSGFDKLQVMDCEFRNFSGTPIAVMYGDKATVERCTFENILGHTSYGGTSDACSGGCYFRDTDRAIVRGNYFKTIDDNAVGISGSGVQVIGNTMTECRFLAYVADSPNRNMLRAVIGDNVATRMYRGIVLGFLQGDKWARNVSISGNQITTDATVTRWSSVHDAFLFDGIVSEYVVDGLQVAGNTINASGRALNQGVTQDINNARIQGNMLVHQYSNNLNLGADNCVMCGNTIVTNGVNASQRGLQSDGWDVHGNRFTINTGLPPTIINGENFGNYGF